MIEKKVTLKAGDESEMRSNEMTPKNSIEPPWKNQLFQDLATIQIS